MIALIIGITFVSFSLGHYIGRRYGEKKGYKLGKNESKIVEPKEIKLEEIEKCPLDNWSTGAVSRYFGS